MFTNKVPPRSNPPPAFGPNCATPTFDDLPTPLLVKILYVRKHFDGDVLETSDVVLSNGHGIQVVCHLVGW